MSHSLCLDSVPDDELLARLSALLGDCRRLESEVVLHIAEVDARKLYRGQACASMFSYCCEVLHLSEAEAYLRIAVARVSRRVPAVLDMLADGRLHLSAIAKLAPHLDEGNAEALLARAVHKTKREIEELVAEVAPRPEVPASMRLLPRARSAPQEVALRPDLVPGATLPSAALSTSATSPAGATPPASQLLAPDLAEPVPARGAMTDASAPTRAVIEPIAPARYKVAFTASAELRDKLGRAQALLRHKLPDGDLAGVIDEAVTLLLAKLEGRRFGTTAKPRKALPDTDTSASSRNVPAAVRRAVFARDGGQCTFVDQASGRRCSCTDPGKLEYHHVDPYAMGGDHNPDRIALFCTAHNQHQAELDFGADTIARHRRGSSRAREAAASYGESAGARPRAPRIPPGRLTGGRRPEQRLDRSGQAESPRGEPEAARRRRSPWCGRRPPPTVEALRASAGAGCAARSRRGWPACRSCGRSGAAAAVPGGSSAVGRPLVAPSGWVGPRAQGARFGGSGPRAP